MATKDYINPTKENPVFVAENSYSGYIVNEYLYKGWEVKNEQQWICGETTALHLTDAISETHKHIQAFGNSINKDAKFVIFMIDGSVDKFGEPIRTKCYSISMKDAKKFKLI